MIILTFFNAGAEPQMPLIYEYIKKEIYENTELLKLLNFISEIFKTPEIESWLIDEKSIAVYRNKINNLRNSSLILSKLLIEEQIECVISEAARDIFTTEVCNLYKRRLEESSYIFLKTNRTREAEISLTTAYSLSNSLNPETLFFPKELIKRSIFLIKEINNNSLLIYPESRIII